MAGGARIRSGGGLRSSGRIGGKSTGIRSSPRLSTSEQQENLLRKYPGVACVVTRPHRSGVAGRAVDPDKNYPFDDCRSLLGYYYDITRLRGSDHHGSVSYRNTLLDLCGIKVSPDELDKEASTSSTNASAHF